LRAIFRACYARFRYCATKEKYMSKVTLTLCAGKDRRLTWVRKDEDYVADFCLVSRRTLDDFEYKVFRFHFLLGADWRLCCRQMKIDRGTFFHTYIESSRNWAACFATSNRTVSIRWMNTLAERFARVLLPRGPA
jgi:hypothetical protein